MTGVVNADLEPLPRLTVRDAGGQPHDVEVVIDTGFNGFLTVPPVLVAALGLPWLCRQQGQLADGNVLVFDVCGDGGLTRPAAERGSRSRRRPAAPRNGLAPRLGVANRDCPRWSGDHHDAATITSRQWSRAEPSAADVTMKVNPRPRDDGR